jgi:phospholipid/cholesterol/gamma-HCH transport system substrate-binding protein
MSRANPTVIGAFVVGAIALIVIGLLVFGGASWFAKRNTYIAYFPGSVKGLRVGAPVDFRGVNIGDVTDIRVVFDPKDVSARIPVVMQFDPSRIDVVGMVRTGSNEELVGRMIQSGFRAQLQSQSFLTGLLFVNLDFEPNTPVRLVGGHQPYPELPTIPSGLEQLQTTAGDIAAQLPGLIDKLNGILEGVGTNLQATSGDFRQIVGDVASLGNRLHERTPAYDRLVDNVDTATGNVSQLAATVNQTLKANQDAIGPLIKNWTATAGSVQRMADQINAVITENRAGLRDFTQNGLYEYSGLAQDAQRMVDQVTRATEEFQRDPARFLFGDRAQGVSPK